MKKTPSKSGINFSSLLRRVLGRVKGWGLAWFWPVFGFCSILVVSWLVNVVSGHWENRLEAEITAEAGVLPPSSEVIVHGRDVELRGTVPTEKLKFRLEEAVRRTSGVRNVASALQVSPPRRAALTIQPAPVYLAPSIFGYRGAIRRPVIRGIWPHQTDGTLQVKLAGRTYIQGQDGALNVKGGHFSLTPETDLADGKHDVDVQVQLPGGMASTRARGEVFIDTTAPGTPTIGVFVGTSQVPAVRGTWDRKNAKSLEVKLSGKEYLLGLSPFLVSDEDGNWTLFPQQALKPGIYDVVVTTADRFGNTSSDVSENELVIGNVASATPGPVTTRDGLRPVAMGKWGEGTAQVLEVVLNGKTYRLGVDKELTSDGEGRWFLAPGLGINDGVYNLTVRTIDETASRNVFATTRKIEIDNRSPQPPKIEPYYGYESPSLIYGTWDEKEAVSLEVRIADTRAIMGEDRALRGNAFGKWILKLDAPLGPGTYDVEVFSADRVGNVSKDQTVAEIVVKSLEDARPFPWFASLGDGSVVLRGQLPRGVDEKKLLDHLDRKFPNAQIINQAETTKIQGDDSWAKTAALGIDQLTRLNFGSVQIFGTVLTVHGDASNETIAQEIRTDVEERLSEGFTAKFKLTVDKGVGAKPCQAHFDHILVNQRIVFDDATAVIAKSSLGLLDQLTAVAKLCSKRMIEIVGHTDSSGDVDANLDLSQKRAEAVAEYFAAKLPGSISLSTVGFGETRPLASNKTLAGRERNRRIEFRVLP
jgi:OOP family OmpA-OmpF porin